MNARLTRQDPTATKAPVDPPRDRSSGLVGGSIDRRVAQSRVPPIDHPVVLAPIRSPETRDRWDAFVSHPSLHIEIGFGRAHHICALAESLPDSRVLGFEIRRDWCRIVAARAARLELGNLRVVEGDARPYMERLLGDATVQAFHILFPDPWWKRRHHKRRLFQPEFLALLHRVLVPGGYVVAKTDVPAYADLMEARFAGQGGFVLEATSPGDPTLASLPTSHREGKCRSLGIPTYAHLYRKECAT